MNGPIIEMRSIVKNFGDVKAVRGASFDLRQGEIHSLIGENGAGKSTMMKLLYGMYDRDGGDISIDGAPMGRITPKLAIEKGVGMVHQEFMLVPELTVLENIILGFEPKKGMMLDLPKARAMVQRYIDQYDMDVQMNKRVNQISVGEAQRVEIIKILSRGANVLILDEPTAVLTPQEARHLFEILENLRRDGKSIVFISHRLNEVMDISDRVTVMRRGETIGTLSRGEWDYGKLARMMIGREVFLNVDKKQSEPGKPILQVENLWTSGEKEISKIRGLSMEVRAGEIVGIAGIDGNGQSELIEAILEDVKAKGVAVLLVSADLREILSLSDRILVMYGGRITGSMSVQEANEDTLGILMMGGTMEGREESQ